MNDAQELIFKKVAVSEKKVLFREIASDKVHVAVKSPLQDDIFHLISIQSERDEILLCHHTADSKDAVTAQKVVVNFSFKAERYFFQTDLSFESGWAVLRTDGDLFQLQRRSSARIELPEKYEGIFILSQHQKKAYFLDCRVKDVSAGGFKMVLPTLVPSLQVGDVVRGTLRLGVRRPIEFSAEVRFAQAKEGNQVAGLQFLNVDHLLENRLLSLMMDLQREIFLKYPQKK